MALLALALYLASLAALVIDQRRQKIAAPARA